MGLALATVSCVLLALVAGLLLLLGQLLRGMRKEMREAPLLAEKLAQQLLAVRQGLEQARHEIIEAAGKLGPEFGSQLQLAQTLSGDLKFLIARAEQMAGKLEQGATNGKLAATVTVTEEKMVQVSAPVGDPLESLLADLEVAAGQQEGAERIGRSPSQAELDLRKSRN